MTTQIDVEVVRKHPHAHCEGCPLYEKGTYVQSTFPVDGVSEGGKRLAFIGEAPGENEIKKGEVFIGLSGKVLDGVLRHYGINRRAALMTNASACHYPKEHFERLPADAIEHCRPRLLWELEQAGVETAVTLGAHAVKSLIKTSEGITLARAGGPRPSTYAPGTLVVPTFHPAFAMRDHTKFQFIVGDMGKVNDSEWDSWVDPEYHVINSVIEANHAIMRLWRTNKQPLVVDTESGADKDEEFGGAIKDVLCTGVWDEALNKAIIFPTEVMDKANRKLMARLFLRNGLKGQNLKYDIARVLNTYLGVDGVVDIPIKGDTMLQSYALRETSGIHSLDYMAREYLGAPKWKHWIDESMEKNRRIKKAEAKARGERVGGLFTGKDYSLVDRDILYKYNAFDVGGTRRLEDYFDPQIDEVDGLREFYDWLIGVVNMLVHVEQNGMEVDLDYNAELEAEYAQLLSEIEFSGPPENFNPRSTPQIHKFLSSIGFTLPDTRADTLKEALARYEVTDERPDIVDFIKTLLQHRGAGKLMSTYVTGLRKVLIDGVAHPDFSLLSTTTRLKARRPNSHNTPKGSKLRKQYRARQGKIYVHADFGQAELRVMAWLARDEMLRKMFMTPGDIFWDMCCAVYPGYEGFDKEKQKKCRQRVKTIAYGTAYGRGANSIAKAEGLPLAEARKAQRSFNAKIPAVLKYQAEIRRKAMACEDLVTVFGGRRRFRLVTDQNKVDVCNEAMAHMPQATSNGICLTAAVELDRAGIPMVNLIHDAIMAEVDVRDAEEVGALMYKTMVATAERITDGYVPFKVDVDTGYTFGDF